MTMIMEIVRGLVGLFIDDEFLAVAVLVVVALATIIVFGFGAQPLWAGAMLIGGNVLVLALGSFRTARRSSKSGN